MDAFVRPTTRGSPFHEVGGYRFAFLGGCPCGSGLPDPAFQRALHVPLGFLFDSFCFSVSIVYKQRAGFADGCLTMDLRIVRGGQGWRIPKSESANATPRAHSNPTITDVDGV